MGLSKSNRESLRVVVRNPPAFAGPVRALLVGRNREPVLVRGLVQLDVFDQRGVFLSCVSIKRA